MSRVNNNNKLIVDSIQIVNSNEYVVLCVLTPHKISFKIVNSKMIYFECDLELSR